jgi:hypothetical protein
MGEGCVFGQRKKLTYIFTKFVMLSPLISLCS